MLFNLKEKLNFIKIVLELFKFFEKHLLKFLNY